MFTIKSIFTAILFSLFIYLEYFNISYEILDTVIILYAFYLLLNLNKKELFSTGFIIGILWFYWIGYSFIYYELIYIIPIAIIGIGIIYGIIFYFAAIFNNIIYKVVYFFILSYIEPFGFNWFKIELPFINTYISTNKISLLIVLISTAILIYGYKNRDKLKISLYIYILSILSLGISTQLNLNKNIKKLNLKIVLNNTHIAQENRWDKNYRYSIIKDNLLKIEKAIKNNNDIIIFPETAFPLILNKDKDLFNKLKDYSKDISIITGALYLEDNNIFNSTYLFQNEKIDIANKVVLVPFGEAVPFPKIIRDFINNTFYNGAKDYEVAKNPTTFNIKGIKFRNAICYEATTDKIYQNLNTNYIIITSNNAWFTPSIEPTLQDILLKYYSNKYDFYYYHITNSSPKTLF
ncbi:MAG: apolipoprotein N-acyltransferase [Campylobacterota bacterium]|nr:apolipoprotein N-acyltransferase [Campylobacterota bacterium]